MFSKSWLKTLAVQKQQKPFTQKPIHQNQAFVHAGMIK